MLHRSDSRVIIEAMPHQTRETRQIGFKPTDLYDVLKKHVIGQDEALKYISVAIFKHIWGEPVGNILMIGNSGTGKTTIMRAIERFYQANPSLQQYRVVVRMNANTLIHEDGQIITGKQLFKTLQDRAVQILGKQATPERVRLLIEHATICIDEVDKVSTRVGDKPNPTGIHIQQSLLTLMEDEKITFDTRLLEGDEYRLVQMEIDTSKLLFICGGAFEELYNQVYARVLDEGGQEELSQIVPDIDGNVAFEQVFTLTEHLRPEDLFTYGMLPQFLSRFDTTLVLKDLTPEVLESIFAGTEDSLFQVSKRFFQRLNIELRMTEEARRLIAYRASLQPRVGARALKDIYSRVIKPFEFEPFQEGKTTKLDEENRYTLTLTEEIVKESLGLKRAKSP
jgi:ATP-dependent Clp protease ATP-binding subunit ClpX